jgi:hypothetical protein
VSRAVFGLAQSHIPEASDGILTSAGIWEGFAGAGVSAGVLLFAGFAGFAGLVAGTLAMGAVEYSKLRAEHDRQVARRPNRHAPRSHVPPDIRAAGLRAGRKR